MPTFNGSHYIGNSILSVLVQTYQNSASAEGSTLSDGTHLKISDKDQKWLGLGETFKF